MYIIRELLSFQSEGKGSQLRHALRYFNNNSRQKSIDFVLSDLIDANYGDALRVVSSRHDITGVRIYDKMDRHLADAGMLRIEDPETRKQKWVDTGSAFVRHEYEKEFFRVTDYAIDTFRRAGCDLLHVRTDEDYVKVLKRFFISRNK